MTDATSQKKLSKCDSNAFENQTRTSTAEVRRVHMCVDERSRLNDCQSCRKYGRAHRAQRGDVKNAQPAVQRSDWVAAATAATTTAAATATATTSAATAAAFHEHSIMQLTLTIICWPFAGFLGHAAYTSSAWRWQSILRAFRGGSNANISRQTSQLISPQAISE